MSKHFHFNLGNLPIIMWPVIIMVIIMVVGKFFLVDWLFKLGSYGLGILVVILLLDLINELS